MSAATIPLMVQPPKLENPVDNYARLLSLRNMQAQQQMQQQQFQQQQQLAPLVYQREKTANDMQQLQLQQAQAQLQQGQNLANAMRDAASGRGAYGPQPDTPPAEQATGAEASPIASAPSTQPRPLSSLAAVGASPAWTATPPIPPPAPSAKPASPVAAVAAAATPGKANAIPKPTTQPLDMLSVLDNEFQQGRIGIQYYLQAKKGLVEDREQLSKMHSADLDLANKQAGGLLKRYDAFQQMPKAYQEENWIPMNLQAQKEGLMSADHYSQLIKQFPTLPDSPTLESMRVGLQGSLGQLTEAQKLQQLANERLTGQKLTAELPETQAKADQAGAASAAQNVLAFTDSPASYSAALDRLRASNPSMASRFPAAADVFDQNGQARPEIVQQIRNVGMNPEQQNAADIARANAQRTANYQNASLDLQGKRIGLEGQRLDIEGKRLDQSKNAQVTATRASMGKVWNDTVAAMQGRGVDPAKVTPQDAIAFLKDRNNWGDNPEIDNNRPALMDAFQKSQQADLNAAHTAGSTNKLLTGGKGNLFAPDPDHPGKFKIALPPGKSPTAPATAPPAPPRQVVPPVAPKPVSPSLPTAQKAAPSSHQVGDVVTVRGQSLRINKIYPDGTFDADLVGR